MLNKSFLVICCLITAIVCFTCSRGKTKHEETLPIRIFSGYGISMVNWKDIDNPEKWADMKGEKLNGGEIFWFKNKDNEKRVLCTFLFVYRYPKGDQIAQVIYSSCIFPDNEHNVLWTDIAPYIDTIVFPSAKEYQELAAEFLQQRSCNY